MAIDVEKKMNNADLMVVTQNYQAAIKIYSEVIGINDSFDEAYLYRGELYRKLGQIDNTLDDILKATVTDPGYLEAYLSLATMYESQDDFESAIEVYKKAISLEVDNNLTVTRYVRVLEQLADKNLLTHQPDKAVEKYKQAIEYASGNINLLYKYVFSLMRIGDFEYAHKYIDKDLSFDSNHVPSLSLLVTVYEKTGQFVKGWKQVEALLETYPGNAHIGIIYGKYALANGKQKEAISVLEQVVQQAGVKEDDLLSIHMLLGKLYDSISEFSQAFSHFSRANSFKYNDYDISTFVNQVSALIDYFSEENYNQLTASNIQSNSPIFILGMPRSGTSLIEQILSSHSDVHGGRGELQVVPDMVHTMEISSNGFSYPQLLDGLDIDKLDRYAEELLSKIQSLSSHSLRVIDKLPHNFLIIGLIHTLLPEAKIINCLRDPVDNCLSCNFQQFGSYHPYAYDLSDLAGYYQQYRRLMHHWKDVLNIPVLDVQYESLVQDTRIEVERVLNYLELEWEDNCLEFYNQKRVINTASYTQVSRKIYTDSKGRWLNYEPYIGDLIDPLQNKYN